LVGLSIIKELSNAGRSSFSLTLIVSLSCEKVNKGKIKKAKILF
jgi:hypothetical protein